MGMVFEALQRAVQKAQSPKRPFPGRVKRAFCQNRKLQRKQKNGQKRRRFYAGKAEKWKKLLFLL
jgi:hypothetical protein